MKYFILLSLFLMAMPSIKAQSWGRLERPAWIAVPNTLPHDYGVYYFRKDIMLDVVPQSFPVNVSGDNRYKLFINNKIVSIGPARSDIQHWNYETLDLSPYLHQGSNIIAALVWNDGLQKPEANMSYRTGFYMKGLTDDSQIVNTDESWSCIQDTAYLPLSQHVSGYYAAGPGEIVDMNKKLTHWNKDDCNISKWQKAQVIAAPQLYGASGNFGVYQGWMLMPSTLPQPELKLQRLAAIREAKGVKVPKGLLKGEASLEIPANTHVELLLDQRELTNAYLTLLFGKGKNSKISIGYAESLYDGNMLKNNRNEIEGKHFIGRKDSIIANGEEHQNFTTMSWRTYRYIQLKINTGNEPLSLDDIYGVFTGYPFKLKAELTTSDTLLRQIFDIGWRTARLCAVETYMDCPFYEQLQYLGDTRIQSLISLFNSGDDRLVKRFYDLADWSRNAEGTTQSRYPSTLAQYIQPYALHYIYSLHDYLMYGSDMEFLKNKLMGTRAILDYFHHYQTSDGRVVNLPGWNFTDWVNDNPHWTAGMAKPGFDGSNCIMDLQLLYAYQMAADLEATLGMKEYAELYKKRAELLSMTIREKYWNQNRGLFSDVAGEEVFSQHCNALAILTDLVKDEEALAIAKQLEKDETLAKCSIYFRFYLHQAMAHAGLGNHYLSWLDKWEENIKMGLTTWAEISEVAESRSDCHAWGASPNIELFRVLLGIDSAAPAFKRVKIEPHLGNIKSIAGKVPHPQGFISVNYQIKKGKLNARIETPIAGSFKWKDKEYELKIGINTFIL